LDLSPQLQRQVNFEDTVNRLAREFALNRKFISSSPQRPALGSKEGPEQSSGFTGKGMQDINPIQP
jgi:hypothetical protein